MRSKIEQQVMASVGVVYTARQLVSSTALKLYVCALSLLGLAKLVWVNRVFENFSQVGIEHSLQFMLAAVVNTNLLVQCMLVVFMIAGVSFVRDMTRSTFVQRFSL